MSTHARPYWITVERLSGIGTRHSCQAARLPSPKMASSVRRGPAAGKAEGKRTLRSRELTQSRAADAILIRAESCSRLARTTWCAGLIDQTVASLLVGSTPARQCRGPRRRPASGPGKSSRAR